MARGRIFRRGKDPKTWTIAVELDPDPLSGKRRQKWTTYRGTKREAEDKLADLLTQRATGELVADKSKWTVAQYLEHWLATYVATHCRPKTEATYRDLLTRHVIPYLGTKRLTKLAAQHIEVLEAQLLRCGGRDKKTGKATPLSGRTVRHVHTILKTALQRAVISKVLARNVAETVEPPRAEHPELVIWSAEDARRFLDAIGQMDELAPYATAFAFALETGVRRGELLGLRWQDLDLERGTAQIVQTVQRIQHKGLVFGHPKSSKGRRLISLTPAVCQSLRTHKVEQNTQRLELGRDWHDHGLVFPGLWGNPMDPGTIYHAFLRACNLAGVPRIKFHALRHTHATLLLLQRVPTKVVSERLGHSTTSITENIYEHVLPGMQDAAVKELDDVLRPPKRG